MISWLGNVLVSLIANNQNVAPAKPPPLIKIDRGGGGGLFGDRYEIVDYIAALNAFREIPGEGPVARAVRRTRHLEETLPTFREARERRDAAMFLIGAEVGARAVLAAQTPAQVPSPDTMRGHYEGGGGGIGTILVVGGLVLGGLLLARSLSRGPRRKR